MCTSLQIHREYARFTDRRRTAVRYRSNRDDVTDSRRQPAKRRRFPANIGIHRGTDTAARRQELVIDRGNHDVSIVVVVVVVVVERYVDTREGLAPVQVAVAEIGAQGANGAVELPVSGRAAGQVRDEQRILRPLLSVWSNGRRSTHLLRVLSGDRQRTGFLRRDALLSRVESNGRRHRALGRSPRRRGEPVDRRKSPSRTTRCVDVA